MKMKKASKAKITNKHPLTTESATVMLAGLVLIIIGLTATVQDRTSWIGVGMVFDIIGVIVVSVGVGMSLSPYLAAGKKNGRAKN